MARFSAARFASLKPGDRLFIGERGLFLYCTPGGVRSWRLQPRIAGKRATVVLGRWPDVSLDEARTLARSAMEQARAGLHPRVEKIKTVHANVAAQQNSGQALFDRYFATWAPRRSKSWAENATRWWTAFLAPEIAQIPARDITGLMVLAAMTRAKEATSLHAAHGTRQLAVQVLDQAVMLGCLPANPARSLTRALPPHQAGQIAPMTLKDARELWQRLDDEALTPTIRNALKLLLLTSLRASEVTSIEVPWINGDLVVPRATMKVKTAARGDHVVPLSKQAQRVVTEQMRISKTGFLFPNIGTKRRPMSKSALNRALERMGLAYSPHSFRNSFSTTSHEHELAESATIESALDHARGNATARAYNRGSLLKQRAKLMQKWADLVTK